MSSRLTSIRFGAVSRLVAAAVIAHLGVVAASVPARGSGPEGDLSVIGSVPIWHPDGTTEVERDRGGWLLLNPVSRRGYQLFESDGGGPSNQFWIQSFDLDTLAPIRQVHMWGEVPLLAGSFNTGAGEPMHAFDERRGQLYIPMSAGSDADGRVGSTRNLKSIMVLDEHAFDTGSQAWRRDILVTAPELHLRSLHGITVIERPSGPKLLTQFTGPTPQGQPVHEHYLAQFDAATGALDWRPYPVQQCAGGTLRADSPEFGLGLIVRDRHVDIACQVQHQVAQVVRIPLDANGAPDPTAVGRTRSLPAKYSDALADQKGGRLLFKVEDRGESWWVFDSASFSWVGVITVVPTSGYLTAKGLDPATGRFYALVPDHGYLAAGGATHIPGEGGLLSSDVRLTPAPQLANRMASIDYPGAFAIRVDPAANGRPTRVFVRRGSRDLQQLPDYPSAESTRTAPVEHHYLVIEDRRPPADLQSSIDPDDLTIDVAEQPGVTGANYSVGGSGYGARMLIIGGAGGAVAPQTRRNPFNDFLGTNDSACYLSDREVVAGQVRAVEVSSQLAAAAASPVAVDDNTKEDMLHPAPRCWMLSDARGGGFDPETLSGVGTGWDDNEASCTEEEKPSATPASPLFAGSAQVRCDRPTATASATANVSLGVATGALTLRVAHAESKVAVTRPGGIAGEVVSVARGVEITVSNGGGGSIDSVTSVASVRAGGRPGTAERSLTRTFCGVHLPGFEHDGCTRDSARVEAGLNRLLGTQGRASIPEADLRATPGGYLASVVKPLPVQLTDQLVNRDRAKAVPGLEFTLYRDDSNTGTARQVVMLAGAEVTATYGIYLLSGGGFFSAGFEDGTLPDSMLGVIGANRPDDDAPNERQSVDLAASSKTKGGGRTFLDRLFGRPLIFRPLVEGLLAAVVWFVIGLPWWFATRRSALLASTRETGAV